MGYQRTVSSKFWEDSKVEEFSPEDRYTMLYLLTNPLTNLCGCYEISLRRMSRELGYNVEMVAVIIERLSKSGVIEYDHETSELLVVNWCKYNWNSSSKLDKPLVKAISQIRSAKLKSKMIETYESSRGIPYTYPMDTVCVPFTNTTTNTTSNNKGCGKVENDAVSPKCPHCHELLSWDVKKSSFICRTDGAIAPSEVFWA